MGLEPLPGLLVTLLIAGFLAAVGFVANACIGTPEERGRQKREIAKAALMALDQQVGRTRQPSDMYFYLAEQHRKRMLPGVEDFMFKVLAPRLFGQHEATQDTLNEVVIYVRECLQDTIDASPRIN